MVHELTLDNISGQQVGEQETAQYVVGAMYSHSAAPSRMLGSTVYVSTSVLSRALWVLSDRQSPISGDTGMILVYDRGGGSAQNLKSTSKPEGGFALYPFVFFVVLFGYFYFDQTGNIVPHFLGVMDSLSA